MAPSLEHFRSRLIEVGLEKRADELLKLARPSLRMLPTRTITAAIGSSKLGGIPDLPPHAYWPQYNDSLAFIGQINLRECDQLWHDSGLPPTGLLSFFYVADQSVWGFDPNDKGAWRVLYTPEGEPLVPFPLPADIPDEGRFKQVPLQPHMELTYVPWESSDIGQLDLSRDELFAYSDVLFAHADQRFAGSTAQFGDVSEADQTVHRLLGHPDMIQGDMQIECQLTSTGIYTGNPSGYHDPGVTTLQSGATEWRLLFEVDSDNAADMMWGDGGRLYYWIRASDLTTGNFDSTWFVLQCS